MNDETLLARLLEAALDDTKNLRAERDELVAALRQATDALAPFAHHIDYAATVGPAYDAARAALAKVTP